MADLLVKYKDYTSTASQNIMNMNKPDWDVYKETSPYSGALNSLEVGKGGGNKASFTRDSVKGVIAALSVQPDAVQYILTTVTEMLREDSSAFSAFDGCDIMGMTAAMVPSEDPQKMYCADKAAWILSAVIGHSPKYFTEDNVATVLSKAADACSELGYLEVAVNLLKAESFRGFVWSQQDGPCARVCRVSAKKDAPIIYKSMFALWMVSFEPSLLQSLRENLAVEKIKAVVAECRTEKVIRMCLSVIKNLLAKKSDCPLIVQDLVEEGLLEAVQNLEYEKWRDNELYDDIKEVAQLIAAEVNKSCSFDRYMKELDSGALSWGFIHSSKFFGENIMKFDTGDYKAVKSLAKLLASDNNTTLAVACHDIGQFVALHPAGKQQVARLGVKERVMELMGSTDADQREVRREALLCCQKIMLNKWQDAADKK
jgi:V-type H+-transporting ATPase subunit H